MTDVNVDVDEPRVTGYMQMEPGYGATCRQGWTGPWPPPAQMLLIEPKLYPFPVWMSMPETAEQLAALREGRAHGWTVHQLEQVSASKIPDADYAGMTHVVRGAEYRVTGPWSPDA